MTQTILEGQWFERKAHPTGQPPKDIKGFRYDRVARTIVAFANSNPDVGGLLVVGIADAGEVIGTDWCGLSYQNDILSAHELLDGPNPQMKLVEVVRDDGSLEHVIFVFTPYLADRVAATTKGEVTVRRGDKTVTLHADEIQTWTYEKGQLHFEDETAIAFSIDDLDGAIVTEFVSQFGQRSSEDIDAQRTLRLARLIASREGQPWLTKGGALVFYKDPRQIVPGAYVRYFRYEGRDLDSVLVKDETFEGVGRQNLGRAQAARS